MDKLVFNKSKNAFVFKDDNDIGLFHSDVNLKDYQNLPINQVFIDYKGVRIAAKGDVLNPSSLRALARHFPEEGWLRPDEISLPVVPTREEKYLIPSNSSLIVRVYAAICSGGSEAQLVSEPNALVSWLSLFCIYGDLFLQVYDEYICDKDENVQLTDELESVKGFILLLPTENTTYTEQDIKATCHIILVSMNKTFPEEVRDIQLVQYLKNRKSAVYSTLGATQGELKVPDKFFLTLSTVFRSLPKLRSALFFMIKYNQRIPEFATGIMLLSHSAMTALTCITNFINVDQCTEAHSEPIILSEIKLFMDTVNKKKALHGDLWPYHRVLYPEDGDLNANRFPNLAVAAVVYYHNYGAPTHKQIVIPKMNTTVDNLINKAKTIERRPIFQEKVPELSADQKEAAEMIGLDLAKLRGTKRAAREMGETGGLS